MSQILELSSFLMVHSTLTLPFLPVQIYEVKITVSDYGS